MYKNAGSERKKPDRKAVFLALSLALILSLAIGGTFAYLKAETPSVVNTFTAGEGGANIIEEIEGEEKISAAVENTGSVAAYVRVVLVINNIDEEGNVLGSEKNPVSYNEKNWQYLNGFYYYRGIVQPKEITENLLNERLDFSGKTIDVIAQTVQAGGQFRLDSTPVSSTGLVWGVDFDGTNWN